VTIRTPSWALTALTASLAFVAGTALATVAWFATDDPDSVGQPGGYHSEAAALDEDSVDYAAEPTAAPIALPDPADFALDVKILSKQCFDTAGCTVDFAVIPSYVGETPLTPEVSTTVTYQVVSTTDAHTGSFTVTDGVITPPEESFGQTSGGSVELTAKATEVF
jgi:hypothetical protein